MLVLRCCTGFPLAAEIGGYSLGLLCALLIAVAFLVVENSLQNAGSGVEALGLSGSPPDGIFLDQRSNLCLLPWQADS